mmetsp:Transcript_45590/g.92030  ORF Transcript_45590/g.92030 Transcript_45590/m.92030 type:complete len:203 (-) Transcript_45590:694-1302(-)
MRNSLWSNTLSSSDGTISNSARRMAANSALRLRKNSASIMRNTYSKRFPPSTAANGRVPLPAHATPSRAALRCPSPPPSVLVSGMLKCSLPTPWSLKDMSLSRSWNRSWFVFNKSRKCSGVPTNSLHSAGLKGASTKLLCTSAMATARPRALKSSSLPASEPPGPAAFTCSSAAMAARSVRLSFRFRTLSLLFLRSRLLPLL